MLISSLDRLESSELVRRLYEEETAYLFKHALVQEMAQESLLRNERKRLHHLVATSLETIYADRLDELAARLFQHYDAAGADSKTIEYGERAGDAAIRLSAYREAVQAFERAFELANARADSGAQRIRLMTRLGRVYELQARYDDALALYDAMRDAARERGDKALELAAMVQLATVYAVGSIKYDPAQAQALGEEALTLAKALDDQYAEAKILWTMMLSNLYGAGGASAGIRYGERSLALARALHWREQIAYSLNDLFYIYLNLGELSLARASAMEAQAVWRELDNKPMLTDNLNEMAMADVVGGQVERGLDLLQESLGVSRSIGNTWGEVTAYLIQGTGYVERGDFAHARTAFELCIEHGDAIGVKGQAVMARFGLARIYTYLGDLERATHLALDASTRTSQYALDWNAWAYATLAQVAIARGDWDAANMQYEAIGHAPPAHYFERSLPTGAFLIVQTQIHMECHNGDLRTALSHGEQLLARMRRSDFQTFLPTALNELARVWMAQGDREQARKALDEASALADTLNLVAARFEIALTRLDLREGAPATAQNALAALLEFIPNNLLDSFLNTARVRRVFEHA